MIGVPTLLALPELERALDATAARRADLDAAVRTALATPLVVVPAGCWDDATIDAVATIYGDAIRAHFAALQQRRHAHDPAPP